MITVSDEWKEIHNRKILPESFVEISMSVGDDVSGKFSSVSSNSQASFSSVFDIVGNKNVANPSYYATLEENLWVLDGTRRIFSSSTSHSHTGYATNSLFSSTVYFEPKFSEKIETITPGITIVWSNEYGEYPTRFTVAVTYDGKTVKSTSVTNNNSNVSHIEDDFTGYDCLRIMVHNWNTPNRRVRIDQVFFGCLLVFDKNDLLSYTHEQTGDPFSSELSKNSITFEVDNVNGQWDLLNPTGMTKYLTEKQPLSVRYGMQTDSGVEWVSVGTFYLSDWMLSEDGLSIRFSARDVIGFMLTNTYSRTGRSAEVNSSSTNTYMTVEDYRQNNPSGILYSGAEVQLYERVYAYEFEYYDGESLGASWFTRCRTSQGWANDSAFDITDDEVVMADIGPALAVCNIPNLNYSVGMNFSRWKAPITIPEVNVAEFMQICANRSGYAMWQAHDDTLRIMFPTTELTDYVIPKDWEYVQPIVELTRPVKQLDVVKHYDCTIDTQAEYPKATTFTYPVSDSGEIVTFDNPYNWGSLFLNVKDDGVLSGEVAVLFAEWLKNRTWVSGEFRADPRLELFDVISVESKYGTISPVMITQIKYTYNGSFRGTYKGKVLTADFGEVT